MIVVAFRRLRLEMVAIAVALAGVGVLALVTGRSMHHQYTSSGLADCMSGGGGRRECGDLIAVFIDRFGGLQILIVPLVVLPALLGAFIGGPLVARDVEAGTHRFFWTQSVTRRRWLMSSITAVLATAVVAGGILSLITAAWLDVTNRVTADRFSQLYDMQGLIPIAAAVMAVAIGVLAGALLRRTVTAMAATIGAFIAVRLLVAVYVRPRLMTPKVLDAGFAPDTVEGTGAWILSEQMLDSAGNQIGSDGIVVTPSMLADCPNLPAGMMPSPDRVNACLDALGYRAITRYQPAGRFWTFQILESSILLGIGAAALGVAFRVVGRRIS